MTLPENPSSGYRWGVIYNNGVKIVADDYIPRPSLLPSGDRLVGGGGHRVLRLTGPGDIVFFLRQPWDETSVTEVEMFHVGA